MTERYTSLVEGSGSILNDDEDYGGNEFEHNDERSFNIKMRRNTIRVNDDHTPTEFPLVRNRSSHSSTHEQNELSGWFAKDSDSILNCYLRSKPTENSKYGVAGIEADCKISSLSNYACNMSLIFQPKETEPVDTESKPKPTPFMVKCGGLSNTDSYDIKCKNYPPLTNRSSELETKLKIDCHGESAGEDILCSFIDETPKSGLIELKELSFDCKEMDEKVIFCDGNIDYVHFASNVQPTSFTPINKEICTSYGNIITVGSLLLSFFSIFTILAFVFWYFWKRPQAGKLKSKKNKKHKERTDTSEQNI